MKSETYKKGSLSLAGTVAMGTGVMIGAGIFALTGQVAQFSGPAFPLAFLLAAVVSGFSAYTYIKMSNKYPSAGGIAMILQKAYGPTTIAAASALLMTMSMIINESLVARTFGAYTLQLFDVSKDSILVPVLAVGLIVFAFVINISGNKIIGSVSKVAAVLKVGGILIFAGAALWASGLSFEAASSATTNETGPAGFLAGVALAILAFKGFTTITNSGDEVKNPNKNVGSAIIWSLAICLVVYMAVALAVGSSLTLEEIVAAKDFSLAEASRPAFGDFGVAFTVIIAIIATASGLLASVFAVSRMLAMLTNMNLIPHKHFGRLLRSWPDRLTRRDLLSRNGYYYPLWRAALFTRRCRCPRLYSSRRHIIRSDCPWRLPVHQSDRRPNDRRHRDWVNGCNLRFRSALSRPDPRQGGARSCALSLVM